MSDNLHDKVNAWTVNPSFGLDANEIIHHPASKDTNNQDGIIYIKSSGSFIDSNKKVSRSGITSIICNYPHRGKCWRFVTSAFRKHKSSNDFLLADERGQVIVFSYEENQYHIVKAASTLISALCFVESRKKDIIIAYESGVQVIMDADSKDLVMNIPSHSNRKQSSFISPVRLMRSHPTKPLLINVYDDNTISLWDISKGKHVGDIVVDEAIVEVQFELHGECISIVLEISGAVWYSTATLEAVFKCELPRGERQPRWVAYCGTSLDGTLKKDKSISSDHNSIQYHICMAGDNGNLYSWNVLIPYKTIMSSHLSTSYQYVNGVDDMMYDHYKIKSLFTTVVELPTEISEVVNLQCVHPRSLAKASKASCTAVRILLTSVEGSIYLVDVTELESCYSMGRYVINANIMTKVVHGSSVDEDDVMQSMLRYSDKKSYRRSWLSTHGNLAIAVGVDGVGRLFDLAAAIGYGDMCGIVLRGRGPRDSHDGARVDHRSNILQIQQQAMNSAMKVPQHDDVHDIYDDNQQLRMKSRTKKMNHASSKVKGSSLQNTPLFVLTMLSPEEKRLNDLKLASFFDIHGEFPSRYRSLIWRFLLRLPENSSAFADYVQRGHHKAFDDLYNQYPIKSRKMFLKLANVCNQIGHWSYVCAELSYLPQIVFPMILVFEMDELAAFEACMTMLMNWAYTWSNSYPHPPLHILETLDQLLLLHDKRLHSHLSSALKIPVGLLLWQMISTLFTEVLHRDNWLRAMDFLFLHFTKPEYLLLFTISIIRTLKVSLLSMDVDEKVFIYIRSQQGVNTKDIIKMTKSLVANTPSKYFSSYPRPLSSNLDDKANDDTTSSSTADIATKSLSLSGGRPIFPLPIGRYPAYNGYPKSIVDWQIKEREKILAMDREVKRKNIALSKIEVEMKALENSHTEFIKRFKSTSDEQIKHHRDMMDAEKKYLLQLQQIEEEISQHRLKSLQLVERTANEELDLLQQVSSDAKSLMREKEKHLNQKTAITLNLHKIREISESADIKAQEKRQHMHLLRLRQETLNFIAETLDTKEQAFQVEDNLIANKWKDEEYRYRDDRLRAIEETKDNIEKLTQYRIKEDMKKRMYELEKARQMKITEIEATRAERLHAYSSASNATGISNISNDRSLSSSSYRRVPRASIASDSDDDDIRKYMPLSDAMKRATKALNSSNIMEYDDNSDERSEVDPRPALHLHQQALRADSSGSTYSDLKSLASESLKAFSTKM